MHGATRKDRQFLLLDCGELEKVMDKKRSSLSARLDNAGFVLSNKNSTFRQGL